MTYNEWRDELKANLLSVSDSERRRVLDYYAEAYADRRDAGYSEREIIQEFGAPYDAAKRILSERAPSYDNYDDDFDRREPRRDSEREYDIKRERRERREREREERREERRETKRERRAYDEYEQYERRYPGHRPPPEYISNNSHPFLFAILCILFAVPMFGIFMALVGITIGLVTAPFALLIAGGATMGAGIGQIVGSGAIFDGLATIGGGAVAFGVGLILIPPFFTIVKYLWKMLKNFFGWMKSLLNDGRKYI